jgi:hypothetical protein
MKLIYLLLFLVSLETVAYANGGIVCSPPKDGGKGSESKE